MASSTGGDRPTDAVAVAQRYLRRERLLSGLVAVVVVSVFLGAYLVTSLLPAVAVAVVLIVVVRLPVLRPHGTVRLRSEDDAETVRDSFTGPTPAVLAFQWGLADEVTGENGTATYAVSHLFGLASVDVAVRTTTQRTANGADRVELEVTMNGEQWGTYTATIRPEGDQTIIDVEYTAERRFGLRRLPQQLVARRYRDEALEVQGYTVVERDAHVR